MADSNQNTARPGLNDADNQLSKYAYYLYANVVPVAFWVNKEGYRYGAGVPGREKGTVIQDATWLSKFSRGEDDFVPIDRNEYEQYLKDYEYREIPAEAIKRAQELYDAYMNSVEEGEPSGEG